MAQVASAVVPEQTLPSDLQIESIVHAHLAVPDDPVQAL